MPYGVGVDRAGNVYFPDGNSIKKWTAANNSVTTLFSRSGYYFYGVAVDGAGNVHYSATAAPVFRVIGKWKAASNTFTTLVSSGLSIPRGVAVDRAGNVYFTDLGYQTVRELPHAFVDPTAKTEGPAAGSHVLPGVLPATANLLAPFAPTSDQPWLTVTGITNGVVSFAFEANTGSSNRTAHITLLGQPISITQTAPVTPPTLIGPTVLSNGTIQFAFSNSDLGVSFTVLTATNLSLPLTDWTVAGPATNTAPGLFQFSTGTTNNPQGFYRVRSP
jgi:DNA-binding beta-propeller fold protein YncE